MDQAINFDFWVLGTGQFRDLTSLLKKNTTTHNYSAFDFYNTNGQAGKALFTLN